MRRGLIALSTAALMALAGCSSSAHQPSPTAASGTPTASSTAPAPPGGSAKQLPWERPADQEARVQAAGLVLADQESLDVHYHAHLDVFVNGNAVPVPAGLGINVGPNGTMPEHGAPGIAPLHTHDTDGILHIEAPQATDFTLGQVFQLWGVPLGSGHLGAYGPVKVYVDGKPYTGDPAALVLAAHQEIAVVAGTGAVHVPTSFDFPAGV